MLVHEDAWPAVPQLTCGLCYFSFAAVSMSQSPDAADFPCKAVLNLLIHSGVCVWNLSVSAASFSDLRSAGSPEMCA